MPRSACARCRRRAISAAARWATVSASTHVVSWVKRSSPKQALGRTQRWYVGAVAQQRLADALPEDARLAARGAGDRPRSLLSPGVAVAGVQATRTAVQAQAVSVRALQRETLKAAYLQLGRRLQAHLHVVVIGVVGVAGERARLGFERARLPLQARGEPTGEQQRGNRRVGMVADGEAFDGAQLGSQPGRVEGRRDALAPRGRAQPGKVDHVGPLAQGEGALDRLPR